MLSGSEQIRDRKELFDRLEEAMTEAAVQPVGKKSFKTSSKWLKTLLLEHDWPQDRDVDEVAHIQSVFTTYTAGKRPRQLSPEIKSTGEHGFYYLKLKPQSGDVVDLWLDTISDKDRRFWTAYSISDAGSLDRYIDRATSQNSRLDRVWFWPNFLTSIQGEGAFRGIGLDYDHRPFEKTEGISDPDDYFKVQLWGGEETEEIFKFISSHESFRDRVVIASVRMNLESNSGQNDKHVYEHVKYTGRFAARGNDFRAHQGLVANFRSQYAQHVYHIEREHRPAETIGNSLRSTGTPVFFILHQEIEDLDSFCKTVFSGGQPFRLFGTNLDGKQAGSSRYVYVVDLHTGSKLFFEVYPDTIAMYLYEGACGNTVLRFFTHLQHYFSRRVTVEIGKQRTTI